MLAHFTQFQSANSKLRKLFTIICKSIMWLLVAAGFILPSFFNILNSQWKNLYKVDTFIGWEDVTRQRYDNSCGPAVIATLTAWSGQSVSEESIVSSTELTSDGIPLGEFSRLAARYGLSGTWSHTSYGQLQKQSLPLVVHLEEPLGHFAIVRGFGKDHIYLSDPTKGNLLYSKKDFLALWSGRAFEMKRFQGVEL